MNAGDADDAQKSDAAHNRCMNEHQKRTGRGVASGGEFMANPKAEAEIELAADVAPPAKDPFAPKNDEGLAPYVREIWRMGTVHTDIHYAENAVAAKASLSYRGGVGEYLISSRRARISDIK